MNDYYADLGCRVRRARKRSSGRTAGWPASCTRTSTPEPTRRRSSRPSPARTRCSPTRRSAGCTTWAPTRSRPRVGRASAPVLVQRRRGRLLRRRGGHPGPRQRVQRGQDALVRMGIDLQHAVFGSGEDVTLDTAVVCGSCEGSGCQPGTRTRSCSTCQGRGEVTQVQNHFMGQIRTSRPLPSLPGVRDRHREPLLRVLRRRSGPDPAQPADQGARGCRHRDADPAGRRGRGRPRWGPAGDLYVEVVVKPHESVHPGAATTCTAPSNCR